MPSKTYHPCAADLIFLVVAIAKHTKVGMIWVAGRSPTLVSQNLKATTLTYLAILAINTHQSNYPLSRIKSELAEQSNWAMRY